MSALIKNIQIKNFKSVRDLSLECDRINIFIGKPNAGKSNILEAISLLGAGYSENKFMEGFIRYQRVNELFSDFNFQTPVTINASDFIADLHVSEVSGDFLFSISLSLRNDLRIILPSKGLFIPELEIALDQKGRINSIKSNERRSSPVKKYDFSGLGDYKEKGLFLEPPHGENFYSVALSNPELRNEIQQFLKPNQLDFLFNQESQRMAIVKRMKDSLFSFGLHLVPDTFQRYIFHLAAIFSNRNSVLLFEEPEAHSYPPYVYQLAQHILDDEGGNQFFLTTHNPYFLLPMMQEGKDVAVFATWFENYQTHARRLSEDEIREMLDYGVDVFLNLDNFIPA